MEDKELRRWCIEQASQAGAGTDVLKVAQELFEFAKNGETSKATLSSAISLTPKQVDVLNAMFSLKKNGQKVHGSSVAEYLDITQSYASAILRKLIELGYVERDGNNFWIANDGMGAVTEIL
jgi:predicted transcriptional regulator